MYMSGYKTENHTYSKNRTEWNAIDTTLQNEREMFVPSSPVGSYCWSFCRKLQSSFAIKLIFRLNVSSCWQSIPFRLVGKG
uniref:Uncharacterized protein n=1 Tax=Romanomermis culicivorax TaxID=13658 RepID=A0A915HJZ9_ROMCU